MKKTKSKRAVPDRERGEIYGDDGAVEWVCAHGVGHPIISKLRPGDPGIHTCDGCCQKKRVSDKKGETGKKRKGKSKK